MSNDNIGLIGQLLLQGLQQLQQYQLLVNRARNEGRDVTDAEIDTLEEAGKAIRAAARSEANRQRAGG